MAYTTTYTFEWDENKNIINKLKHGISFETASLIFTDDYRVEYYDIVHSIHEDRYVTIGCVNEVLFVVYTIRGINTRIISARKATEKERELYYGDSQIYN